MDLTIAEQLALLVLSRKGKNPLNMGLTLNGALKRGIMEDLIARGHIKVEKSTFIFTNKKPTGETLLDEILSLLKSGKSPFTPTIITKRVLEQLVKKNVVGKKKVFLNLQYYVKDNNVLNELKKLLSKFTSQGPSRDKKLGILVGLLKICKILPAFFTKVAHKIPGIISKSDVNFFLSYVRIKARMDEKNPDIDRLWQKALQAYKSRTWDTFTINAFPVFEQSLRYLYEKHFRGEKKDVRKMINDLYHGNHLSLDKENLHWVWTIRNDKVHKGIVLAPKDYRQLYNIIKRLVMECFKE